MKKLFLCGALCLLSACASIVDGRYQEVSFDGNTKGIKIKKNGMALCETPCLISLERSKQDILLTAEKEGYETRYIRLKSKMNSWVLGNLITGGLLGLTTDFSSTHAAYEYAPFQFYVDLTETGKPINKKLQEVKRFILKNYAALKAEATKGNSGEYLGALEKLSEIDVLILKADISRCSDAPTCADKIAEQL